MTIVFLFCKPCCGSPEHSCLQPYLSWSLVNLSHLFFSLGLFPSPICSNHPCSCSNVPGMFPLQGLCDSSHGWNMLIPDIYLAESADLCSHVTFLTRSVLTVQKLQPLPPPALAFALRFFSTFSSVASLTFSCPIIYLFYLLFLVSI